jgi:RNA polymerase sigma-70 factor (ECF subfamily)
MTQVQFNTAILDMQNRLLFFALSLTSDQEKANDLLQETFLKALTNRDKFIQNTNFKAWIYTIMKNTFINEYRKNEKKKNAFNRANQDIHLKIQNERNSPSPESGYDSKEIIKSIKALEEEYRIPFEMFLDGYKYKEIAEILDIPLGTVKSRIFFARKKLEKTLKGYVS